ncbi:MAG TPA: thioredoxin [Chloroflexota bacterium]|nr:thioredoxin [Chloroflexota bacterium]
MLNVTCPSCGDSYHVAQEHVGRSLRCRRCETIFEITAPTSPQTAPAASASTAHATASPHSAAQPAGAGSSAPGKPVTVTDQDFARLVLQSSVPVVVDFWAPWCGPCRAIAPALEQVAAEYAGRATVAKLNTDENPGTMTRYGVMGLPTLLIFKGGQEVGRLVGLQPKANIKRALDQVA